MDWIFIYFICIACPVKHCLLFKTRFNFQLHRFIGGFVSAIKKLKKKTKQKTSNRAVIRQQLDYERFLIKTEVESLVLQFFSLHSAAQTDSYFHFFFVPVSLSLCEIPPPSQELVEKYHALKAKFHNRLLNLNLMERVNSLIEQSEATLAAKAYLEEMEPNPKLKAVERFTK